MFQYRIKIQLLGVKVSVSAQNLTNMQLQHPKGLTWHKNKRKDTNIITIVAIIMLTQQNRNKNLKINIGLPPNKRYCLMPSS